MTDVQRDEGVTAFAEDRPDDALRLLRAVATRNPRDRATGVFLAASRAMLKDAQRRAGDEQNALPRITLAPFPLRHALQRRVAAAPSNKVSLEKVSEAKNHIVDLDEWLDRNALTRSWLYRTDETPAQVPLEVGDLHLRRTYVHPDHFAAEYDGVIVVSAAGKRPLVFDARDAKKSAAIELDVGFARLVGSTLLVQFAYYGGAQGWGGKNAYLAAYDATTGTLAWVSDPLVSNAIDVAVAGGSIITGYGFTSEPDFLFVLDFATGKIEQKIALKSAPGMIQPKGDRLLIHAYDMDYVFKNTTAFAPAEPATLLAEATSPPLDPLRTCLLRRAAESLAARDAEGLREASLVLARRPSDRVLGEVLATEADHLKDEGRIDLTTAPLVIVPAPSWGSPPATNLASGSGPKLVQLSSTSVPSVPKRVFDPKKPFFIPRDEKGQLPDGARRDIATSYGLEDLRTIIPDQARGPDRLILIYGGRYLALLDGSKPERVFDLDAFQHPPKIEPGKKEFADQYASYAQERDGVLYVCNGGGSYAKEVFGKKGYLSALDAKSGALLWRSAPLTCNTTFAIAGDHLITAYGFSGEPENVFVVRRSDGAIVDKMPIKATAHTITVDGDQVRVDSWGLVTEFELR